MSVLRLDKRTLSPAVPYGSSVPPLDFAPDAAAAYSLRLLRSAYTGSVVTVRRSTDNAELGFTATQVSNGDLASWCMGGDGFVKTWHDQSGNARDASNSTSAQQPKIVSAGVVITEGGKPALQFDGVNDSLVTASVVYQKQTAYFSVAKATAVPTTTNIFRHQGNVSIETLHRFDTSLGYPTFRSFLKIPAGTYSITTPISVGVQHLICSLFSESALQQYAGGALTGSAASAPYGLDATATYSIGGYGGSEPFNGTISETIAYESSDMTAQRQLIEGNMAWYY